MNDPICTCMQFSPFEHLRLWQQRAEPVSHRLVHHGHGVSTDRLDETIRLILKMETGHPDCFAPENAHRSHHLPDCPAAPRNQGPKAPPEQLAGVGLRRAAREQDAIRRWAKERPEMNSLFSGPSAGSSQV